MTAAALKPVDIGHTRYLALVDPENAFWALVDKTQTADILAGGPLLDAYREKASVFSRELHALRFELKPSAVYVNPTERCNLDCTYCYLPGEIRHHGRHMPHDKLLAALDKLRGYFSTTMPKGRKPRIIFHGSEPLMNRHAVFAAIDSFAEDFIFGLQTNATLLDSSAIDFLTSRQVSIGLSLDGPQAAVTDLTRRTWGGRSIHQRVLAAMAALRGYDAWSVITTSTTANLDHLTQMVELFHAHQVPTCMLNTVRCTLPGARSVKPADSAMARTFIAALERSHALYQETGRKLVVANFANILIAILAPTARRLMCDISPCGGGRAFFALAATGDLYPCSEFIGLPRFGGGNLFETGVESALDSEAFRLVTERDVNSFAPCRDCSIRHFCGSPCPAEAYELNGSMQRTGAFCEFYKQQVHYAFRLIADGLADDYLWADWDDGTTTTFNACTTLTDTA